MRCASGLPNFIGNIRYFKGNGARRRGAAARRCGGEKIALI
jgi:hypothetical protein